MGIRDGVHPYLSANASELGACVNSVYQALFPPLPHKSLGIGTRLPYTVNFKCAFKYFPKVERPHALAWAAARVQ